MGLFDLPAPLLSRIDAVLGAALTGGMRLVLWAAVGGALSMLLYRMISPQGRLAAIEAETRELKSRLDAHEGELGEAMPLLGRTLQLALLRLGIVIGPALVAALPVICLLAWGSTTFGYRLPDPAAAVAVRAEPAGSRATVVTDDPAGARIVASEPDGRVAGEYALTRPVPEIHKRQWWNAFFGNPLGYLPAESAVERVQLDLPRAEYLPFGPGWLRSWEALFFTALLLASLTVKLAFRIR